MAHRTSNRGFVTNWLKPLLIGLAVAVVVCFLMLMLMALAVQAVDIPRATMLPLAVGSAGVGAFAGGFTAAKVAGSKGFWMGALIGALLFLLVLLAGFIRYTGVSLLYALIKAAVLIAVGAVGGILGIGRRR